MRTLSRLAALSGLWLLSAACFAEEHVGPGGKVLFLVPSISLLSQSVREWVANRDLPMRPLAVCSDPRSTRKVNTDAFEDISVTDLALPATTDVAVLTQRIKDAESDTVAAGNVVGTDPGPRAPVAAGDQITLLIAVPIPSEAPSSSPTTPPVTGTPATPPSQSPTS